jgi:co-chaperonin GroES (HSP10)
MKMLNPCGHYVLVKPDEVEKKSEAGIILAIDERLHRNAMDKGTIISIGSNAWKAYDDGHPWGVVGDKIYYAKHAGRFVKDPETDEEFVLLNDEDVQVVITKGKQDE